jgi:hypothetical protein
MLYRDSKIILQNHGWFPMLGRLRKEESEFKASLGYI